jgi:hypothetical protein
MSPAGKSAGATERGYNEYTRVSVKHTRFLSQAKDVLEGKKLLEEDLRALQHAATQGDTTRVAPFPSEEGATLHCVVFSWARQLPHPDSQTLTPCAHDGHPCARARAREREREREREKSNKEKEKT